MGGVIRLLTIVILVFGGLLSVHHCRVIEISDENGHLQCELNGNISGARSEQSIRYTASRKAFAKNDVSKLNAEKLKNIGQQLINDFVRIGQIHYNIAVNNDHSQQFTDNEREQLEYMRYSEVIALTKSILSDILDDPKKFLEIVLSTEKANESSTSTTNGIVNEVQRTRKRATRYPLQTVQSKRSPNLVANSANHVILTKLVKSIQDKLDRVQVDGQYYFNDGNDVENNVFLDYGDYDYNDVADSFSGVDNSTNIYD